MERFTIDSLAFHEVVIAPAFADIIPQDFPYKGTLNEFTLMDDVASSRTIVDIRRHQNILQRRDASCDYIYKKIFGASTRKITVEEVYAATEFCRNSFYQGDLKDFRTDDPVFEDKVLPYFQGAFTTDIASNSYFGDVDRLVLPNNQWSTNVYDGIFKWLNKYIDASIIPSGQTMSIADATDYQSGGGPAAAYALLKQMYYARPQLMRSWAKADQAFYVSEEIRDGYEEYLTSIGSLAGNISYTTDGVKTTTFKGIELIVEPLWTPIITELKGSEGYAAVLTIRGNWVFATDKNYGEGEDGSTALEVWYSQDRGTFLYRFHFKAGTQIALPEYSVVALSDWE